MKAQGVVILTLVALTAAACGGAKQVTNSQLASDLSTQIGTTSPLVCWMKQGTLGNQSAMGYTRVCGVSRHRPSLYVRTGVKGKPNWCLVTPRLTKVADCPLG